MQKALFFEQRCYTVPLHTAQCREAKRWLIRVKRLVFRFECFSLGGGGLLGENESFYRIATNMAPAGVPRS